MSWEMTVNTGMPDIDRQTIDAYRQAAQAQGLELQVQPMPAGGFHVKAVPPGTAQPPPQQHAQPPQQPYAQQQFAQAPQQQYAQQQYAQPPQQQYAQQYAQPPQQQYAQQQFAQAPQQQYAQPPPQYAQQQPAWAGAAAAAAVPVTASYGGHTAPAEQMLEDRIAEEIGAESLGSDRIRYLRKVYTLLAGSAFFAVVAGWASVSLGPTTEWYTDTGVPVQVPIVVDLMLGSDMIFWGAFGLLVVATFAASAVSKVKYVNVAALFGVALIMGVQLAPMAFVAQVFAGLGETMSANPVRDAGLMTVGTFAAITAYIFIARKDFSYLYAALSMGFWVVLGGCILTFFVDSEPFALAVASVGALFSAGFLLYVTSWIFKNSEMDDPVGDALAILVQLRNLFMFLLRIFMSRR